VISTVPASCAGANAVIDVDDVGVNADAGALPNNTCVAPARFVPVMVTLVAPPVGPALGLTAVTVGAPARYAN
jgi:hypothetical protein